jgi:hypothetical protein
MEEHLRQAGIIPDRLIIYHDGSAYLLVRCYLADVRQALPTYRVRQIAYGTFDIQPRTNTPPRE